MPHLVREFGRIVNEPADWFLYLGLFLAAAATVGWLYRRDVREQSRPWRWVLISLRLATWGLLFWVFLDHRERTETPIERPSRVLILADDSLSMTVADPDDNGSPLPARHARMKEALARAEFLTELRHRHEVSVYAFGRDLQSIAELPRLKATDPTKLVADDDGAWHSRLTPTQDQSRLAESLLDLLRKESVNPLAGVVVLSDFKPTGTNDFDPAIRLAQQAKTPIHAGLFGSERRPVNLRLADLQLPSRAFRGDQLKITGSLHAVGLERGPIKVELLLKPRDSQDPAVVAAEQEVVAEDGVPTRLEFTIVPKEVGDWEVALRTTVRPHELRTDDNTIASGFEVVDRRTKILLFAGGPAREYQFLRNLLARDRSIELNVFLQSARDRVAQEADKLLIAFPSDREELFSYDLIIAIDPDWTILKADESQKLLQEWVGTQAGGLIVIPGTIHGPRLVRSTELAGVRELLPVQMKEVLTSELASNPSTESWSVAMTSEGLNSELLSLDDDPKQSALRWREFIGFYMSYPVSKLKPAASVLASFADPRAQVQGLAPPLFATHFFGAGRVFYIGSAEMWRLRQLGDKYYERFWVRLARQLTQGRLNRGSGRGMLLLEADRAPLGAPIPIRAHLLDPEFKPLIAQDRVAILINPPTGVSEELVLTPEPSRPGQSVGMFQPKHAGSHRLQLLIPNSAEVIERRLEITVPDTEFEDTRLDRSVVDRLTSATGGRAFTPAELTQLPALLVDRTETTTLLGIPDPLWDHVGVMLALVALLGAEWLIRKLLYLA